MSELLSPCGSIESFYSAIKGGCNAIYLGLNKFSARAYANNFDISEMPDLIKFAHLRNVKIYITINTIIYDDELEEVYTLIDKLMSLNIDAIIVQDLTLIKYISDKYGTNKVHASTQVGVDNFYSAKVMKEFGASRIVLARETPIEVIKEIKDKLDIELEVFIHGALCVSYSGNCLMSSMIGNRSGNRGRCAGCCRQIYSLINKDTNKIINKSYILSMKDLNTSSFINNLKFIDSLKIEGRMKEPEYTYEVTNIYRNLLDNKIVDTNNLNKIFNREYTKGFLFHDEIKNITNINKPNNFGYLLGEVCKINKNKIWIRLFNKQNLTKGDQIRIDNKDISKEISVPITKLFDANFNLVNETNKIGIIYLDKKVNIGDKVYKVKDINLVNSIDEKLKENNKEYEKLPINIEFNAFIGNKIVIKCTYLDCKVEVTSDFIVDRAIKQNTTKENIYNQLNKLGDTPYFINNLNINIDNNIFIPLKLINELRRDLIDKLNIERLKFKIDINNETNNLNIKSYELNEEPTLTVEVSNIKQYELVKSLGIKHIYFNNIINRNNATYVKNYDNFDEILTGNIGSIEYYKNKNINLISDYSFNVTNHISVAILNSLGFDRVTLSQEIPYNYINNLVSNYYKEYNTYPNLELIIYGRTYLMHSKYCPLKRLNMCGDCKKYQFELKDRFTTFPIRFNNDCAINILNSKRLNNINYINKLRGVNYFRLVFTDETNEEIINIINSYNDAIKGINSTFNNELETHGHFFEKPL